LRKYVFIVLSVFLLLSFATLVYAEEPQIKLGGNIMVRGWYVNNATAIPTISYYSNAVPGDVYAVGPDSTGNNTAHDTAFWTEDLSLTLDAKVSDNVQGFIELEISQGETVVYTVNREGDPAAFSAGNPQSGSYLWGNYESKPNADLKLRQAWIQYTGSGLLGVPAGIKIGHQLLTLGEKQFLNHERFGDDALLVFVNPTKELSLAAVDAKLNEGYPDFAGDDVDAYVLMGTYNVDKDNKIGLYYFFANNSDMRATLGDPSDPFNPDFVYNYFNGLSLQDIGVHANGTLSGILKYALEIDTQFGKLKGQQQPLLGLIRDDVKYAGYAIYLKGGYKIPETPLNLRASFAYGSGDKDGLADNKIKEFQACMGFDSETAIDRYVHYTQIYERSIATASLIQTIGGNGNVLAASDYPHRNTGIANTTYYNLGADLAATKDLSMSLDGYILRASKTGGWESVVGNSVSKNVGWELDFTGSYKLAKNLNYFVEAGYFSPGSFYQDTKMVDDKNGVTQLIHGLSLTF
jgi:hypothetical protein